MKIIITESQYKLISEMSQSLYHGSIYDFDDFDVSKMSTGHGDQWFGWGIYFTDEKVVADGYAASKDGTKMGYIYHVTLHGNKTPDQYDYIDLEYHITPKQIDKVKKGIIREKIEFKKYYTVCNDNERLYLDKPYFHNIKDAEKYKDSLANVDGEEWYIKENQFNPSFNNIAGEELYEELCGTLGSPKEASLFLLRCGIDGLKTDRYFDAYVWIVFDTSCVKIEKKEKV